MVFLELKLRVGKLDMPFKSCHSKHSSSDFEININTLDIAW